jgi:glycerol uptake facilitator-like aquaporin
MTIHCVTFVGKNNEPLFLSSAIVGPLAHDVHTGSGGPGGPGVADALQLQCIAHSALDIIEEKRGKKWAYCLVFCVSQFGCSDFHVFLYFLPRPAGGGAPDMFLGHLFPAEDFRV